MRKLLLGAVCVAAMLAVIGSGAYSAEEKQPAEMSVIGTVTVTKEGDAVKKIEIACGGDCKACPNKACTVVLDENGKKLEAMNGKTVEVKGTCVEKDGALTLTVTGEAKEVEAKKAADVK